MESEGYTFASTWSERHAAHTFGIGTFGLCDGLITSRGKAMRCGSLVANIQIPSTKGAIRIIMLTVYFFQKEPVESVSSVARLLL